jgi:hypothetical protein
MRRTDWPANYCISMQENKALDVVICIGFQEEK